MGAAGGLGERHGYLVGSFDAQAGAGGVGAQSVGGFEVR